jgi:hypothetical protein
MISARRVATPAASLSFSARESVSTAYPAIMPFNSNLVAPAFGSPLLADIEDFVDRIAHIRQCPSTGRYMNGFDSERLKILEA